jgi:hypothetical protein
MASSEKKMTNSTRGRSSSKNTMKSLTAKFTSKELESMNGHFFKKEIIFKNKKYVPLNLLWSTSTDKKVLEDKLKQMMKSCTTPNGEILWKEEYNSYKTALIRRNELRDAWGVYVVENN